MFGKIIDLALLRFKFEVLFILFILAKVVAIILINAAAIVLLFYALPTIITALF